MIKEKLKKIKFLVKLKNEYKIYREFKKDKRFFIENYLESSENINIKQYDILLIVHGIEKAFLNKKPRRFGIEKVKKLINDLNYIEKNSENLNYEYYLGLSCLKKYCEFYEKEKWTETDEYTMVSSYLKLIKKETVFNVPFGKNILKLDDIMAHVKGINYKDIVNSRHSIRSFSDKKIDEEVIEEVVDSIVHTPSACNRQMCKIYFINDESMKEKVRKYAMGLGNFELKT